MAPLILAQSTIAHSLTEQARLYPVVESTSHAKQAKVYQRVFHGGNWTMLIALVLLLLSIIVAYTHSEYFSLTMQTVGHIVSLLAVTAIKIGYLMRCVGLHGLGAKQL